MRTITVDGCSICQLHCPQCPVSQMGYQNTIGKGYLTFENFKELLLLNPGVKHVDFDNFGELFLNKDLLKILQYADIKKVMLSCSGGVNLNDVSPEVLEGLVKYRFQYLNVSIDGATPDTYEMYRKGGDWHTVIENVHAINRFKKQYHSQYPKLQWQYIVFGHNEHEIADAKVMAELMDMSFYPKMNWNSQYSPIRDPEKVRQETGWDVTTREEYEQKYGISYMRPTCFSLWNSPRYSWDLSVTGCCWNVWNRFNDITLKCAKQILTDTWSKPKEGKSQIHLNIIKTVPCNNCEILLGLARTKQYLTRMEILTHIFRSRARTEATYWLWRSRE